MIVALIRLVFEELSDCGGVVNPDCYSDQKDYDVSTIAVQQDTEWFEQDIQGQLKKLSSTFEHECQPKADDPYTKHCDWNLHLLASLCSIEQFPADPI